MGNTKLKVNKKVNQKVKTYYENIKESRKIINHDKLLKRYICLYVPRAWFGYLGYLLTHK